MTVAITNHRLAGSCLASRHSSIHMCAFARIKRHRSEAKLVAERNPCVSFPSLIKFSHEANSPIQQLCNHGSGMSVNLIQLTHIFLKNLLKYGCWTATRKSMKTELTAYAKYGKNDFGRCSDTATNSKKAARCLT